MTKIMAYFRNCFSKVPKTRTNNRAHKALECALFSLVAVESSWIQDLVVVVNGIVMQKDQITPWRLNPVFGPWDVIKHIFISGLWNEV